MFDSPPVPSLRPGDIEKLQELIKSHCGIRADAMKLEHSLHRAWPSLRTLGIADVSELIRQLTGNGLHVWPVLLPFLTVNETYFLREGRQLDDFMERALPELQQRASARPDSTIRVLSAACSSGEEPYTLSALLTDAKVKARVVGVDIDPDVLLSAEEAVYTSHSFRGVPEAWKESHFEPATPRSWRVRATYRQPVEFKRVNLLQVENALLGARFDAIFCRNVLIYFDRPTQLDVIQQLRRLLVPGGYLFLGHSEMFFDVDLGLEVISTDRATMYRRKEGL